MTDEYGATLLNICNLVKKGMICFVPSYRALDTFLARWQTSGILDKMKGKKQVRTGCTDDKRGLEALAIGIS